jgi:hypothetical protein
LLLPPLYFLAGPFFDDLAVFSPARVKPIVYDNVRPPLPEPRPWIIAEWDNASGGCNDVDAALLGRLSTVVSGLRQKVDFVTFFISATAPGQVI